MPPDTGKVPTVFDRMAKEALCFTDIYDHAIFLNASI